MRKVILFMHVSLDGFVAGPNGEMDWIHVDDDMFDYAGNQTDEADTALYGRKTYEMMESYWPTAGDQPNASRHDKKHSSWYNNVHKVILSRTLKEENLSNTEVISTHIAEKMREVKKRTGKNIIIFGSPSASHALMSENLIDEYWLFVNPVLIGEGIPLFKDIKNRVQLKLITTHTFAAGVVCLNYSKQQV